MKPHPEYGDMDFGPYVRRLLYFLLLVATAVRIIITIRRVDRRRGFQRPGPFNCYLLSFRRPVEILLGMRLLHSPFLLVCAHSARYMYQSSRGLATYPTYCAQKDFPDTFVSRER